jgi:pimeloyl-ACP methyl ester carboxylesterase
MRRAIFVVLGFVLGLGLLSACVGTVMSDGDRRFPLPEDYPPGMMAWRTDTQSGLRVLEKIRPGASLRVIVVTGTPSWPEYWAPVLAALPDSIDIVVPTRPGFGQDRTAPRSVQTDLDAQAAALAPFLDVPDGQRVIILGQSYGTGVAILLADLHADRVAGLMITSPFWDRLGPSARTLLALSWPFRPILPGDFKAAIREVGARPGQTDRMAELLDGLDMPVSLITGGKDTLVAADTGARMLARIAPGVDMIHIDLPEGDHFLNACCVADLVAQITALDARSGAASGLPALSSSAKDAGLSRRP